LSQLGRRSRRPALADTLEEAAVGGDEDDAGGGGPGLRDQGVVVVDGVDDAHPSASASVNPLTGH
jgi:hypothetical protein